MIKVGTTLKERYEIRERVARGGFATVYSAWDSTFERKVAVKVVDLSEDENGQLQNGQELLREARVVASYHHPNVLDVYDFGDLEEQTFLVMPYADGGTLHQFLRQNGPLSYEQADSYLQQIAAGLDHAHRLKVIHRDLKPQNLLLFGPEKQRLVISDFGVAKAVSQSAIASVHVTGTPRYMSPEQFMGRASYSSDIYALGLILYQMLVGEPPFRGDQAELMYSHTNVEPSLLSTARADAPPALDQLIQRTLAKDPTVRPKSAGELAHSYQQIITQMRYAESDYPTLHQSPNFQVPPADSTRPFTPTPTPLTPSNSSGSTTPPPYRPSATPRPPLSSDNDATSLLPVTPGARNVPPITSTPVPIITSQSVTPPPKKNRLPLLIGGLVALVAVIGLSAALLLGGSKTTGSTAATATVSGGIVPSATALSTSQATASAAASTGAATAIPLTALAITSTPTTAAVTVTTAQSNTPTAVATPYAVLPPNGDPALAATIELWTDDLQNPQEGNVLATQIAAFNKLFPNVKINVKPIASNEVIDTKFPAAIQAGTAPDLVIAPVGVTGEWAANKIIQPLDTLLGKDFLQTFDPNALAGSNVSGIGYGLPYNYGNILVLYYNKKLAPSAPATFDELIKQAQALTKSDGSQVGLALNRYDFFWLLPFLSAFEGWPVDNAGQVTLNTAPMRNALQYFKDLTDKHKVISPTLGYDEANKLFEDGKLAFFINGDWALNEYQQPSVKSKVDLGVAPLPTIDGRTPRSMTNGRHYFLSSKATGDRLKASLYFLQFQAQLDQQKQLLQLGLLPPTKAALTSPDLKNNTLWAAVADQLKDSKVQPVNKGMTKVWNSINRWMKAVMDGTASPAEAAEAMQEAALKE